MKRRLGYSGFTLIELLFVIAIIVMLLSLLLPSLSRAKDKTRQIVCQGNLKQIYFPTVNYSSDNDEYYPPSYQAGTGYWYWQTVLTGFGYIKVPDELIPSGILSCPTEVNKTYGGYSEWNTWKGTHYGMSVYLVWAVPLSSNYWTKLSSIPASLSKISFFGDKDPLNQFQFSGAAGYLQKYRHNNGISVLFCDGHGEYRKMKEVPHEEIDPYWYQNVFWGRRSAISYW